MSNLFSISFKNIIIASLLLGCTHGHKNAETFEAKVTRINPKHSSKKAHIEVEILDELIPHSGRELASINNNGLEKSQFHYYSNKNFYFGLLYAQFSFLKNDEEDLSSCPNFHNTVLENKKRFSLISRKKNYFFKKEEILNKESSFLKLHPEYSLPAFEKNENLTVSDYLIIEKNNLNEKMATDLLEKAIGIYGNSLKEELLYLCEYGKSDEYYRFENLVKHIQTKSPLSKGKEGLQTLLKLSIIKNMALIKGLRRPQARVDALDLIEDELYSRLKVQWSSPYFNALNTYNRFREE